jgi:hypothetical protein
VNISQVFAVADTDRDDGNRQERKKALARLAALQRLRDQMESGQRSAAMLAAIDRLIDGEAQSLRQSSDRDGHPQS